MCDTRMCIISYSAETLLTVESVSYQTIYVYTYVYVEVFNLTYNLHQNKMNELVISLYNNLCEIEFLH